MAAPVIQLSADTLRSKASDVRSYRAEHDEVMAKLKTLVYALNEIWKGEAQDAFLQKYESMQSTFTSFSELLEAYAKSMDTTAAEFEAKDQALKSTINNMFS